MLCNPLLAVFFYQNMNGCGIKHWKSKQFFGFVWKRFFCAKYLFCCGVYSSRRHEITNQNATVIIHSLQTNERLYIYFNCIVIGSIADKEQMLITLLYHDTICVCLRVSASKKHERFCAYLELERIDWKKRNRSRWRRTLAVATESIIICWRHDARSA